MKHLATTDPRRAEFTALVKAFDTAWQASDTGDSAEIDAADTALDAFAAKVYAAPAKTIHDVAIRADLADYWRQRSDGNASPVHADELVAAVYAVTAPPTHRVGVGSQIAA